LDDPLTLVSLFALLRGGLEQGFTHEDAELCRRLYREFMLYCARTHSLRKVFVSLKGYYYQASIHGQTITWVMPHQLKQSVPKSVDVRVMLTFLQFYATMLKFVNFRLYHEIGLAYPPPLDAVREQRGEGIGAIVAMAEEEAKRRAAHAATAPVTAARGSAEAAAAAEAKKSAQRELDAAVSRLREKGKAEEDARDAAAPAARSTQDPKQEDSAPNEVPGGEDGNESESEAIGRLFKGLVFVLGREAPLESLEFVVRSAGGETVRADELSPEELKAPRFTHQIVDRPAIDSPIAGRVYVQPQWVFDSFNSRALLPSHPYAPGVVPPPHLSPFVNDYEAGYVPRQRELLEQWGAQPQSRPAGYVADAMESGAREQEAATVKMAGKEEEDEEDEDEEKDEEDEERDEDEDEDEADEDDEDEDDEEDDEESDGEDEEDDQAAEPAKAAPAAPRRRERPLSESEEHMQLRKVRRCVRPPLCSLAR
jgi:pescadillo protein